MREDGLRIDVAQDTKFEQPYLSRVGCERLGKLARQFSNGGVDGVIMHVQVPTQCSDLRI